MLHSNEVPKKQRVRTCQFIPLSLDPPLSPSDAVNLLWTGLSKSTTPSSQADAVNKFGEVSSSDCCSDADIRQAINLLCQSLFQCPLKAQLTTKITRSLHTIQKNKPDIFYPEIHQVLNKVFLDENAVPQKLCHALALVMSSKIVNIHTAIACSCQTLNGLIKKRCSNEGNISSTSIQDMNNSCETQLSPESGMELHLHVKLCDAVKKQLSCLSRATFDEHTPHVTVSTMQHELQELMKSTVAYLQTLTPALGSQHNETCGSQKISCMQFSDAIFSSHMAPLAQVSIEILAAKKSTLDLRLVSGQLLGVLGTFCDGGIHALIVAALELSFTSTLENSALVEIVASVQSLPILGRIAVLHGLLCTVPSTELLETRIYVENENPANPKVFGMELLKHIFVIGNSSADGELTVSCSRLLNHWTLRVLSARSTCEKFSELMPVASELEKKLLEYLELTWEHYLDRVKHTTYETFMNFLEIRQVSLNDSSHSYFMSLACRLVSVVPRKKFAVSALRCLVKHVSVQTLLDSFPGLPLALVKNLADFSHAGCCSEALKALFLKHIQEVSSDEWQEFWITLIFDNFSLEMTSFGFELLIKNLLETCPSSLAFAIKHVLKREKSLNYEHYMLLISCLKVGKNFSEAAVKDHAPIGDTTQSLKLWKNLIPYSILQRCLFHVDEWVQISAFGLICDSQKLTDGFEQEELNLLLEFFRRSLSNDVPSRRQAMRASAKHLFQRLQNCYKAAKKITIKGLLLEIDVSIDATFIAANDELRTYKAFCEMVTDTLFAYLHPSYSYSRRCCALWILSDYQSCIGVDSDTSELRIQSHSNSKSFGHDLLLCLNDNYLHNKETATKLLLSEQMTGNFSVDNLFECVFSLASSCKPSDSLTASHVLQYLLACPEPLHYGGLKFGPRNCLEMCRCIYSKLKCEIKQACEDIFASSASHPMYGLLFLLRVVFARVTKEDLEKNSREWCVFIEELVLICRDVHSHVRFVVENDSPEGNIPLNLPVLEKVVENSLGNRESNSVQIKSSSESVMSIDRLSKATGVSAQMLLLCAWRTVKEISGLFADICQHHAILFSSTANFSVGIFEEISDYFIQVLALTKHRGAFEQTYAEYLRVCEQLWLSKNPKFNAVPETWIENIICDINSKPDGKFCATRRSAGIPFIILGALTTEPPVHGSLCLQKTMECLLASASSDSSQSSDARLHALNILRVLYRDAKLGDSIIPFVSDGVKSAICGFSSAVWSIRNSSTLLFAALVTRMLGVKRTKDDLHSKNAMSALLFFKRFPDLYKFLLEKLEEGVQDINQGRLAASLYPILLLLARLSPSPLEGMTSSLTLANFVPLVVQCSKAQIFRLRDLASRALAPLVSLDALKNTICLLSNQTGEKSHNSIHGALLSIHQLLLAFNSHVNNHALKSSILEVLKPLLPLATLKNPCCVTRCATLNIFHLLAEKGWLVNFPDCVDDLVAISREMLQPTTSSTDFSRVPWYSLMQKSAAEIIINTKKSDSTGVSAHELLQWILFQKPFVRILALERLQTGPVSPSVLQSVVQNLINEENLDCRIAAYTVVLKTLENSESVGSKSMADNKDEEIFRIGVDLGVCAKELDALLSHIMTKIEGQVDGPARLRDEELVCIIPLLQHLLCRKDNNKLKSLSSLCCHLQQWSDADQAPAVRLEAARATVALLQLALSDAKPSLLDYQNDRLLFAAFECLVLLLQDDDSEVRRATAAVWLILLALVEDPSKDNVEGEFSPVDDLKKQFGVECNAEDVKRPPRCETNVGSAIQTVVPSRVTVPCSNDCHIASTTEEKVEATGWETTANKEITERFEGASTVTSDEQARMQEIRADPKIIPELASSSKAPHALRAIAERAVGMAVGRQCFYGGSVLGFTSLCADRVLNALLLFIGNIGGVRATSLLCSLILRDLSSTEFGLSEEDDRAFDKSETSTHREELVLADYAVESLMCSDLRETSVIMTDFVLPHIVALQQNNFCSFGCCLEAGNRSGLLQPELALTEVIAMICKDICHICCQLCAKKAFSWQITNSSAWLVKLYKRVTLAYTLIQSCSRNFSPSPAQTVFKKTLQHVKHAIHQQYFQSSLTAKILAIVHLQV
ncbi:thyroid adenoma-associated protein homolog isoform X2 [Hyalella azteca]|uniref:tRNA (32-2'-O)-methyltransferase regulator THADA n=1 Tax=Hyalella azteca TaxID=294128 RepID=A0A979FQK6_HYAAZ|nr:thyroid adenoma-associated protein homolog isoform X2 [Hyalella azteca]